MTDTIKGCMSLTMLAAFITLCVVVSIMDGRADPGMEAGAVYSLDDLLDAIEWVESKGDPHVTGDTGEAVGAYQIHEIYVDDVNRILELLGFECKFSYSDRRDKELSREMTRLYTLHYLCKAGGLGTYIQAFERIARIHNGGPNGYKKESTLPYWNKVKARIDTTKLRPEL